MDETVSLTFWFKTPPVQVTTNLRLSGAGRVALLRNIERLVQVRAQLAIHGRPPASVSGALSTGWLSDPPAVMMATALLRCVVQA